MSETNSVPSAKTIQLAIIEALEALSDQSLRYIVEAWRLPQVASEPCNQDSAHGPGYCYGPTGDPLCLACQVAWIEANLPPTTWISVDVAR